MYLVVLTTLNGCAIRMEKRQVVYCVGFCVVVEEQGVEQKVSKEVKKIAGRKAPPVESVD